MSKCLICDSNVETFMSFGKMPIANGFLLPEQFNNEYFFDLQVGFCPKCTMVQLTELVERDKMFHENYAYFSSISVLMAKHFKEFSSEIKGKYLTSKDPFVVEIGSNDGIMLQHFSNNKIRHLGIEPSANVAQASIEKGINTICKFFDVSLAKEILDQYGPADVIIGANVMCHLPYLHSVIEGVEILLKSDGVLIFEDPYLGDIIEKTSYDQIYDEHAFYFSISSLSYLFDEHGLEIVDAKPQNVHGGSMRYTVAKKGVLKKTQTAGDQKAKEVEKRLDRLSTFEQLKRNIQRSRDELLRLLKRYKNEGKRIVGYGATSKSTTVLNYCGIDTELIEFISDTTPTKQGKFTPGMHIPVRAYEEFIKEYPDFALLFAWNHAEEILAKEQDFLSCGGKWIVYVPEVMVLA